MKRNYKIGDYIVALSVVVGTSICLILSILLTKNMGVFMGVGAGIGVVVGAAIQGQKKK